MQALLVVLALPLQTNRAALTTTSPGGGEMLWEVTHRLLSPWEKLAGVTPLMGKSIGCRLAS